MDISRIRLAAPLAASKKHISDENELKPLRCDFDLKRKGGLFAFEDRQLVKSVNICVLD